MKIMILICLIWFQEYKIYPIVLQFSSQKNLMSVLYKMLLSVFFIHAVFSFSLQEDVDPKLYLVHTTDHDAVCLDGSPGAYYISKNGDPKKFYIQFEGGGWCWGPNSISQTLEDCLSRTKTGQGSSKFYPPTVQQNDGVLSINEQNNFKDWTRVFFKYCDGSGHQGTRKNPVSYKGTNLYFRGHNVTVGQLNSLQKNNKLFSQATHVVVGGDSAGGLAVFLWTNYIKDRVRDGKVWALPDSGIFLDETNILTGKNDYRNVFKNLMSITNVEIAPPVPECVAKHKHEMWQCMFAVNLAPHLKTPLFVLQSLYDVWSVYWILGIKCVKDGSLANCDSAQRNVLEQYHRNTTNAIFEMAANNKNGYFAPVCANHVYSRNAAYFNSNFRIPKNSQNSMAKGVSNWLSTNADPLSYRLIDLGQWPDNLPCAGQVNPSNIRYSYFNNRNKHN